MRCTPLRLQLPGVGITVILLCWELQRVSSMWDAWFHQMTESYLLCSLSICACWVLGFQLTPVLYSIIQYTSLIVDPHPSSPMGLWSTRTQLRGHKHTIIAIVGSPWRETAQQYVEQVETGALHQSVGNLNQVQHIKLICPSELAWSLGFVLT